MNVFEVKDFFKATPAVFYKVFAKPMPGMDDLVYYRFPGLGATGYFIENADNILTFADWLIIDKIEVW